MEQIPKIVGQRLRATAAVGPHPDPGLLTAFVEKSLSGGERGQVLEHLARCADCREVVALSLPEQVGQQAIFPKPARAWGLSWPVLRWAAFAACVVVVGAVVADRYVQHEKVASFGQAKQTESASLAMKTLSQESENDHLAAKLETPQAPQLSRELDRATRARPLPMPAPPSVGAKIATSPVTKNLPDAKAYYYSALPRAASRVPSASESVEVPPGPSASGQGAAVQSNKEATADASLSNNVLPRSTNEAVEVTAEAPLMETTEAAPGKAKDAKQSSQKELQAQMGSNMVVQKSAAASELSLQARNDSSLVSPTPPAHWTLSADGAVERSLDAGKTWQPVQVASHVVFRAVSAQGTEVWAGGAGGALYHSSDGGQTWMQVKPAAGSVTVTSDIISLQFVDAAHGQLTTADHQTWITSDSGKSWRKQ